MRAKQNPDDLFTGVSGSVKSSLAFGTTAPCLATVLQARPAAQNR